MDKLVSIIVDDESNGRQVLSRLLKDHCPEIEIAGIAESAPQARLLVEQHAPDVVFLDITMPVESGFDFLDGYEDRPFSVVFVTAYHEHALRAIKASAVDYILKPIDLIDLREAIRKLTSLHREAKGNVPQPNFGGKEHAKVLHENLQAKGEFTKIILHRPRGIKVVNIGEILHIRSDSHYTTVRLVDDGDIIVTGSLKEYEEMLGYLCFCRIHKSFLVNLMHVTEYTYDTSGKASLSNGETITVSKRRTREFLMSLQNYVDIIDRTLPKK